MRIRTASTRRAIDKWKGAAKRRARNSQFWALDFVAGVLTSSRRERFVYIPPLILALSFHFAFIELGILVVAGFYVAKLYCVRFVNSILGLFALPR